MNNKEFSGCELKWRWIGGLDFMNCRSVISTSTYAWWDSSYAPFLRNPNNGVKRLCGYYAESGRTLNARFHSFCKGEFHDMLSRAVAQLGCNDFLSERHTFSTGYHNLSWDSIGVLNSNPLARLLAYWISLGTMPVTCPSWIDEAFIFSFFFLPRNFGLLIILPSQLCSQCKQSLREIDIGDTKKLYHIIDVVFLQQSTKFLSNFPFDGMICSLSKLQR